MDICNKTIDSQYILRFLELWGNPNATFSDKLGYDCVEGTKKDKINLLDFLNVVIQNRKGDPVRDWCNSCTTLQQTEQGYLTITGALELNNSSSSVRPLYFNSSDVESSGSLKNAMLDIENESWNNPNWPGVIVKTPKEKINILDKDGNVLSNNILKIETLPVKDVSNFIQTNGSNYTNYYYLFIKDSQCADLPLPVYQSYQDSSVNPNILNNQIWPLVSNNGTPLDISFTGCPENCDDWEWNKEENFSIF